MFFFFFLHSSDKERWYIWAAESLHKSYLYMCQLEAAKRRHFGNWRINMSGNI